MRTLSISAVVTINLLIGLRYVWLLRKKKISPALAMWVFFTIAIAGASSPISAKAASARSTTS